MSLNKKRLAAVGSALGVTGLVLGGVAFAAFNQTATAQANGAGAEKFAPLTVTGQWLGRDVNGVYAEGTKLLLPGESGDVRVELSNPSSNTVQGKVLSITPGAAVQDGCKDSFVIASYSPGSALVVQKGSAVSVILKKAVTLKDTATEACQGQSIPTSFQVKFEATRDPVQAPATLNPNP